ncbi:MAG: hypothetical protein HQL21_09070 [Candidatus Omnitrophica bacterium]|nr:hypothetical protein [Candidatus Omnitrophota bacterium]
MNPLDLKNNALFLSCWYERARPVPMICFGILILSIMFLSFFSISLHVTKFIELCQACFYVIVGAQVLVLIFQGAMFASHMASRERTGETLDFHRNSPQPVNGKIMGLLFGSTWFEWGIFFALLILELPFAFLAGFRMSQVVLMNISLILSGVFFHTIAAMSSLLSTQKKRGGSIGLLLLFFWFGAPFLFFCVSSSSSPFFSHLLGLAAFQYIAPEQASHFLNGRFYLWEFPLIMVQVMIQGPLLFLIINGMKRIFCLPNSPAWSKVDVIRFCIFLFFIITGFFVASYTHVDDVLSLKNSFRYAHYTVGEFLEQELYLFTLLFVVVGAMVSFFCVPIYSKCSKYFVLKKGTVKEWGGIFDDGASSFWAIALYIGVGALFSFPYLMVLKPSFYNGVVYFVMLSVYVAALAGFLEFFRLSRFRNNKIFFVTVLLMWWVFVPWMLSLPQNFKWDSSPFTASISPLFGIFYAVFCLLGKKPLDIVTVVIPCLVAGVMWLLAYQEHKAIERQMGGQG